MLIDWLHPVHTFLWVLMSWCLVISGEATTEYVNLDWEVVEGGTSRGQPELINNLGFSYCRSKVIGEKIHWRCTMRNKCMVCPSKVIQKQNTFVPCGPLHQHPANKASVLKVSCHTEL